MLKRGVGEKNGSERAKSPRGTGRHGDVNIPWTGRTRVPPGGMSRMSRLSLIRESAHYLALEANMALTLNGGEPKTRPLDHGSIG